VADLVAQGKCHYYDLPDQRLRDLRSLLLLRKRLKKQLHSAGCASATIWWAVLSGTGLILE